MRFDPPPLELAHVAKGEYFTDRDVVCPTCAAEPGEDCTTVRCACRRGCCCCNNHDGGRTSPTHYRRRGMWKRWVAELEALDALKRVDVPFGFPACGHFWKGMGQGYCALLVTKNATLRPQDSKRKLAGGSR